MSNEKNLDRLAPATWKVKMGAVLASIIALINEMRDDHATYKTAVDTVQTAMKNMAMGAAGLAISSAGGFKKKLKIANTVPYLIDGVYKAITTVEVAFTATTHDIAANAGSVQEAVYLLSLDGSGTPTITKGATATGAGNAAIPNVPASQSPIGHARIAVAAGSTPFDATTDDLDAVHLTVTYTDLAFVSGKIGAAPASLSAAQVATLD